MRTDHSHNQRKALPTKHFDSYHARRWRHISAPRPPIHHRQGTAQRRAGSNRPSRTAEATGSLPAVCTARRTCSRTRSSPPPGRWSIPETPHFTHRSPEASRAGTISVTALTPSRWWLVGFRPGGCGGGVAGIRHRPMRYNRRRRWVFCMAALSSLKVVDGPSRRFYDKKRTERLVHTPALPALVRRLIDVLWALLRDGCEFILGVPAQLATAARHGHRESFPLTVRSVNQAGSTVESTVPHRRAESRVPPGRHLIRGARPNRSRRRTTPVHHGNRPPRMRSHRSTFTLLGRRGTEWRYRHPHRSDSAGHAQPRARHQCPRRSTHHRHCPSGVPIPPRPDIHTNGSSTRKLRRIFADRPRITAGQASPSA